MARIMFGCTKTGRLPLLPLPSSAERGAFLLMCRTLKSRDLSLDLIRRLMVERTRAAEINIHNPTWISEFKIHCRLVDRYRLRRVFVAGDAAHVHSPTGGQGS